MSSSSLWRMVVLILGLGLMPGARECLADPPVVRVAELRLKDNSSKNNDTGTRPVVSCIAIEVSSGLIASVGDDYLVRVSKLQDGSLVYRMAGHTDWVRAAAFQPKGKTLATAGDDRRIILWDTSNGTQLGALPQTSAIRSLAYSSDGKLLACTGFDGHVRVYSGTQLQWDLQGPGTGLYAVAFSPDTKILAAAGRTGKIRLWNTSSGQAIRDLDGGRWIRALVFADDSTQLASGGLGRTVRLWNVQTGKLMTESPMKPGQIRALVFCGPALLASGRTDCHIQVWDAATLQERTNFNKHTGTVTTLAWDAANGLLLSGSFDTTIQMFYLGAGSGGVTQRPAQSPSLR